MKIGRGQSVGSNAQAVGKEKSGNPGEKHHQIVWVSHLPADRSCASATFKVSKGACPNARTFAVVNKTLISPPNV